VIVYAFSPERKTIIEYKRLDELEESFGHQLKVIKWAEKLKYQVIQIFEDEWRFKRKIVLAKLRYLAGESFVKLSARKCQLQIIERFDDVWKDEIRRFVKKNIFYYNNRHFVINMAVILRYKEQIVACMTFSKNNLKNLDDCLIMTSYVVHRNYNIRGNFSRMIKHIKEYIRSTPKHDNIRFITSKRYFRMGLSTVFFDNEFKRNLEYYRLKVFYTDGIKRFYSPPLVMVPGAETCVRKIRGFPEGGVFLELEKEA
jgi:hypothetical protein